MSEQFRGVSTDEVAAAMRAPVWRHLGEHGLTPEISFSAAIQEKLRYDMDEGCLITESYPDGAVREAIEIRKGLEDALVLQGVVLELRRRGYTVIPPGGA